VRVGEGTDDQGSGTGNDATRVGGSLRVAEGELHGPAQAGGPALDQIPARVLERAGVGDTEGGQPGTSRRGAQLVGAYRA
jgi:hypothetical protein